MFLRILLWLVLLVAGWWFFRSRGRASSIERPAAADPRRVAAPEAMVDCAHCGVHLPASEALGDDAARAYCCAAHRAAGPRA